MTWLWLLPAADGKRYLVDAATGMNASFFAAKRRGRQGKDRSRSSLRKEGGLFRKLPAAEEGQGGDVGPAHRQAADETRLKTRTERQKERIRERKLVSPSPEIPVNPRQKNQPGMHGDGRG